MIVARAVYEGHRLVGRGIHIRQRRIEQYLGRRVLLH
jgi:hypothetical protein